MKKSPITLSDAAANDILEQAKWYEEQANSRLGHRWESAVSRALLRIVKNPRSGAPCTFKALELRNVRRMPVSGFPPHRERLVHDTPRDSRSARPGKPVLKIDICHAIQPLNRYNTSGDFL